MGFFGKPVSFLTLTLSLGKTTNLIASMKIFTAEQLSKADKTTIEKQGISSEDLMERAASLVFEEIHKRLQGAQIPVKVFCGIGNNGGDGLVVARYLVRHGYKVKTYIVNFSDKRSGDFLSNYEKLKQISKNWPVMIRGENDFPEIKTGDFIVDAIFGIGLNKPLKGWLSQLVKYLNKSGAFTLSIDMPSGLFSDRVPGEKDEVIEADYTLSFQAPKLVFYLPQTMDYVGEYQILDIGLDREFLGQQEAKFQLINREEAFSLYRIRKKNSHKGDYGHSLIAGGSYGKIGSVVLAARAALRSGTGLCSLYVPECGYEIAQTALPEAMVLTDVDEKQITSLPSDFPADVFCFGMGGGTTEKTVTAFREYLQSTSKPILVDADGLNILSDNRDLLEMLPEYSVLTPHPGELKRLIGGWKDDFDKLEKLKQFSLDHKVVVVLKGAHTFITDGNHFYINNSGDPGMATAGSGDVLSGVITSLMGQNYEALRAAILGVFVHGLSGEICTRQYGAESVMAGNVADNIGKAFQELQRINEESGN